MVRAVTLTLAFFSTSLQQPPHQPPHPLEGVWRMTYPWHLEVVNGVVTPTMEQARFTVETRGDSLIATITPEPSSPPAEMKPRRLAVSLGSLGPDEAVFVMRDAVMLTTRESRRTGIVVSTWILKAEGDQLSGTLDRRVEETGLPSHGPQPLTGKRVQ